MGINYHTPLTEGASFKPTSLNPPFSELDRAITYLKNVIVHCDGSITYNKATGQLAWSDTLRIIFNREDGDACENTVAAGNVTVNDNEFAYVDLSETDGQAISVSTAAVTTDAASNFIDYNRLVLAYRNSGSDELFPVYLKPIWGTAGTHSRLHDIDSTADHNGVSGATENNLISFDANGLPKDSSIASTDVSDAVSKKHDRDHDIDSTADHNGVSGATEDNVISFDANGLPKDSGIASSKINIYDVGCTYNGKPAAGVTVLRLPFVRAVTFPASLTGSKGVIGTAATAQSDFDILKNDVSFGTMRFAASATTATFISASGASFSAGDVLTVTAPSPQDDTLEDLGFMLTGTR